MASASFFIEEKEEKTLTDNEAINQGLRIIKPNFPRQNRAFPELKPIEASAYLMYRAFFKITEICTIIKKSKRCVNNYISKGCGIYGERKSY